MKHDAVTPLVSVVIPTAKRPALLLRAVRSALAQTLDAIEVIVVVDGQCEQTQQALAADISDPRLRVLVNAERIGAAESRNRGVVEAAGTWVALLDDDDEWLPRKLELQLEAARRSNATLPVVTGRLIARGPWGSVAWPRRLPQAGETIGEYLFVRRSATQGEAVISTITLLAPRQLLLEIPFASSLPRHQEWDWLLRVEQDPRVRLAWVEEPIAVWHVATERASISRKTDWRFSLQWMKERSAQLTPRARAGFIATVAAGACRAERDRSGLLTLTRELCATRCVDPVQWYLMLAILLVPDWCKRLARRVTMRDMTGAQEHHAGLAGSSRAALAAGPARHRTA